MQKDLDVYFQEYNYQRSHQGRNMNGRTPYEVFEAGIKIQEEEQEILEE